MQHKSSLSLREREDRMTAGYSATPLAQKLSLKPGMRALFVDMPGSVRTEIDPEGVGLQILDAPSAGIDVAHIFVTRRADLERDLTALKQLLAPSGFIWVSWPKKAAKVDTDITEDIIRDVCLPIGLVDVKVCAIDAVWSGLKLMVRRKA